MNIVSVEKDKDTRVVSFDETGKILSVSSIEPQMITCCLHISNLKI